MTEIIETLDGLGIDINGCFISLDPKRDSPRVLKDWSKRLRFFISCADLIRTLPGLPHFQL